MRKFIQFNSTSPNGEWQEVIQYLDDSGQTFILSKNDGTYNGLERTGHEEISEIDRLLTIEGQPILTVEEKSWFISHLGMSVSSKVAEPAIFSVTDDQVAAVSKIRDTVNTINKTFEAKSECGTIRFLDHIANSFDWIGARSIHIATKIRHYTWKTTPPCVVNFKKAK